MITAIFNPGDKSITTEKLLQWDYGQVLSIKGLDLPKAVEIHFCVYTDSTTITAVGITTDDHTDVEIPDGLLRQDRELRAYVYVADLEQGKTVRTVNIPIQSRQKPEIPHTPEDTEIFREAIKAVNDSADRAETAANTSEQNAKKTAEDRKTIEEMVETVSGIEQQVQDVKKYAGQAETAASNAALSERESKKSENAALQAKADAETAKGSAETAAGKTEEDRTAVERVKEEVLQAKQQVSTDRAAVEVVERKVAQMGNAIPQAVLEGVQAVGSAGAAEKQGIVQAGTEQKSAVESAGTKTIEDINLAKKSATDAVETAKTGAVGAIGTAGAEQTQNVTTEGAKQVKAVENKGNEVLQSIPEDFTTQMASKLDKQQGAENKGKALVVGNDGNVTVGEVQGGVKTDKTLTVEGVAADSKAVGDGIKETNRIVNTTLIEGYDLSVSGGTAEKKEIEITNITQGERLVFNGVGQKLTREAEINSCYATVSVIPGKKYHVVGWNFWNQKVWVLADSDDKLISFYGENAAWAKHEVDLMIPENATTLYIGCGRDALKQPYLYEYGDILPIYHRYSKVGNESIKVKRLGNEIRVSNGNNILSFKLDGSGNRALNITYMFDHAVQDDLCPVKLNGSYVSGNHGWPYGIVADASGGHGKTEEDIGSVYARNGKEYIILQVPTKTRVILIRKDGSFESRGTDENNIYTHVSGGTHTTDLNVKVSKNETQIYPSINKISQKIYADGKVLEENGEYNALSIIEEHDIVIPKDMCDFLISNIGNNTNNSVGDDRIAGKFKRITTYTIDGDMALTVSDSLYGDVGYRLDIMGIVQSNTYGNEFFVPYTSYKEIQTLPGVSNLSFFESSKWDNVEFPPHKYYQVLNGRKCNVLIYPPYSSSNFEIRKKQLDGNAGGFGGGKLYPLLAYNQTMLGNSVKAGYAIRKYAEFDGNGVLAYFYKTGKEIFAEIEAKNKGIFEANIGIFGMYDIETIRSQNAQILTERIVNGIAKLKSDGVGSLTLKLNQIA